MSHSLKKWACLSALLGVSALSGYPAQQVKTLNDKDIKVIDYADLRYPGVAITAHVEGVVVVRVTLDKNGNVSEANALSGADILVKSSLENARKWRFEPNPENAAIIIYNFRLRGACHQSGVASQMIFYPPNFAEITACPTPVQWP